MSRATPIIFFEGDHWRIGTASSARPTFTDAQRITTASDTAAAIAAALNDGDSIVIALDASHCLTATIALDDLPRRDRRQAMVYRLEEKLPIAAEEFAANLIERPASRTAFGIVTRVGTLLPMIDALRERGIAVGAILPAAIVSLATVQARTTADLVCWRRVDAWEVVTLDAGVLSGWFLLRDGVTDQADDELLRRLAILSAARGRPLKVTALGVARDRVAAAASVESIDVVEYWSCDEATVDAIRSRAETERSGLWIDLRQDALAIRGAASRARRPLLMAAAGVTLVLLAIGAAASVRATKYRRVAEVGDRRLETIYAELFPSTPTPVAIRSRLASEARLASPDRASATPAAVTPTATRILVNCLSRIPGDLRASVSELRIGGDAAVVALSGEATSFVDAQSLASALKGPPSSALLKVATNALLSFEVDSPRTTQRADRSVSFSMNATPHVPLPSERPPAAAATAIKSVTPTAPPTPPVKKGKR